MLKIKLGEVIPAEVLKQHINGNSVIYQVTGVSIDDLTGGYFSLQEQMVDNIVERGCWLGNASYRFVGEAAPDGTATIEVHVKDVVDWGEKLTSKDERSVVYSETEKLFWSNTIGWVSLPDATRFYAKETIDLNLPIGGRWVTETEAKTLPQND